MMANAARDPVFWAGVAIAAQDRVDTSETNDCIRCHSPSAFLGGRGDAISPSELMPDDFNGISCDLCHRAYEDMAVPAGNARYVIDDVEAAPGEVAKRGPWVYEPGATPPHAVADGSHQASSRLCGTCHDVTTPRERVDENGTPLGMLFNEQRTYSEWTRSVFAVVGPDFRSCQDCHMPAVDDVAGCNTNSQDGLTHPTGARRHDLVGANRFVLAILKDLYGSGGANEVYDVWFDLSMDRMDELLRTSATLEVVAPTAVDLSRGIDIWSVTVTNETGHKLPTGYSEGRIMWIEVVARYHGNTVYSSGQFDQILGIQQDEQLRTYVAIAEESSTGAELHLLRNDRWVLDTRIPPRGLTQHIETDPVGTRYVLQGDGTWPNSDTHAYAFLPRDDVVDATPEDASDDTLELSTRLLYLVNTPEYIEFLAAENRTNEAGNVVLELFEARGGAVPVELASWTASIPVTGLAMPVLDTTAGVDEDSSSSGTTEASSSGSSDTGHGSTSETGTTSTQSSSSGTNTTDEGNTDSVGSQACGCQADPVDGGRWTLCLVTTWLALRRRRGAL